MPAEDERQCYSEIYESAELCQVKCLDTQFQCTQVTKTTHQCCKPRLDSNINIKNRSSELGFPIVLVIVIVLAVVTILLAYKIAVDKAEIKRFPQRIDEL